MNTSTRLSVLGLLSLSLWGALAQHAAALPPIPPPPPGVSAASPTVLDAYINLLKTKAGGDLAKLTDAIVNSVTLDEVKALAAMYAPQLQSAYAPAMGGPTLLDKTKEALEALGSAAEIEGRIRAKFQVQPFWGQSAAAGAPKPGAVATTYTGSGVTLDPKKTVPQQVKATLVSDKDLATFAEQYFSSAWTIEDNLTVEQKEAAAKALQPRAAAVIIGSTTAAATAPKIISAIADSKELFQLDIIAAKKTAGATLEQRFKQFLTDSLDSQKTSLSELMLGVAAVLTTAKSFDHAVFDSIDSAKRGPADLLVFTLLDGMVKEGRGDAAATWDQVETARTEGITFAGHYSSFLTWESNYDDLQSKVARAGTALDYYRGDGFKSFLKELFKVMTFVLPETSRPTTPVKFFRVLPCLDKLATQRPLVMEVLARTKSITPAAFDAVPAFEKTSFVELQGLFEELHKKLAAIESYISQYPESRFAKWSAVNTGLTSYRAQLTTLKTRFSTCVDGYKIFGTVLSQEVQAADAAKLLGTLDTVIKSFNDSFAKHLSDFKLIKPKTTTPTVVVGASSSSGGGASLSAADELAANQKTIDNAKKVYDEVTTTSQTLIADSELPAKAAYRAAFDAELEAFDKIRKPLNRNRTLLDNGVNAITVGGAETILSKEAALRAALEKMRKALNP